MLLNFAVIQGYYGGTSEDPMTDKTSTTNYELDEIEASLLRLTQYEWLLANNRVFIREAIKIAQRVAELREAREQNGLGC